MKARMAALAAGEPEPETAATTSTGQAVAEVDEVDAEIAVGSGLV